jgi:hypothetical protein
MQVRITQRFLPAQSDVDLEAAAAQLTQRAKNENDLVHVKTELTDGGLVLECEGFVSAEPDGGFKAQNVRKGAEDLGLRADGTAIVVLEFPDDHPAGWVLG